MFFRRLAGLRKKIPKIYLPFRAYFEAEG